MRKLLVILNTMLRRPASLGYTTIADTEGKTVAGGSGRGIPAAHGPAKHRWKPQSP